MALNRLKSLAEMDAEDITQTTWVTVDLSIKNKKTGLSTVIYHPVSAKGNLINMAHVESVQFQFSHFRDFSFQMLTCL